MMILGSGYCREGIGEGIGERVLGRGYWGEGIVERVLGRGY